MTASDTELLNELVSLREKLEQQIGQRIVGQKEVVDLLLTCLFARGHCLLVGVPGLAKTLLVATLSEALDLSFNRIQFTPDLMPSDITGTEVLDEHDGTRSFRFIKGPVFTNLLLADEINRTPPKTQAALLQCMQERVVTTGGTTYPLSPPFMVFATQNPIEQEGTYPLPEAQLDRFMMEIPLSYPSHDEEIQIATQYGNGQNTSIEAVATAEQITAFQDVVERIPIGTHVVERAVSLVRNTRPSESDNAEIREFVSWGAGPRAAQYLVASAKSRAALHGRLAVHEDDIDALAPAILAHRVVLNYRAAATQDVNSRKLVTALINP